MSSPNAALGGEIHASWRLFLDTYEPLRPELYRYCRHLTRSPWDAEDMVQEALARAFVSLGLMSAPPEQPRAWLFRVASNLWLNRVRGSREQPADFAADAADPATEAEPRATREAAGTLLSQLAPQERAALVLKDAFGFSLEEVASALATTSGAVKASLHRGRGKLVVPEDEEPAPVAPPVLDAFCEAFNARDLERLTALLLEDATLEYPGFKLERGAAEIRAGTFLGTLFGCPDAGGAGHAVAPASRCELRVHRGEGLFLWWWGGEVHSVVRSVVHGERLASLTTYYHAPDVLREVCGELGVPVRTHGYYPAAAAR